MESTPTPAFIVNPAPTLSSTNPNTRTTHTRFQLTAIGSNFTNNMTIQWDGGKRVADHLCRLVSPDRQHHPPQTTVGNPPHHRDRRPVVSNSSLYGDRCANRTTATPSPHTATNTPFTLTVSGTNFTNTHDGQSTAPPADHFRQQHSVDGGPEPCRPSPERTSSGADADNVVSTGNAVLQINACLPSRRECQHPHRRAMVRLCLACSEPTSSAPRRCTGTGRAALHQLSASGF